MENIVYPSVTLRPSITGRDFLGRIVIKCDKEVQ